MPLYCQLIMLAFSWLDFLIIDYSKIQEIAPGDIIIKFSLLKLGPSLATSSIGYDTCFFFFFSVACSVLR